MIFFQTIAVALSMFSSVPMPNFEWNRQNMRYVMCAFPMVGIFCGLSWLVIYLIPMPDFLRGALFCLAPVLVTGGIHLDGYADTSDALSSYGDAEKKQAILRDPHTGAFAVIRLCCYFVMYFALCVTFKPSIKSIVCVGLGFILSRTLSGLSVASLTIAKDTGLVHTFATSADKKRVRFVLAIYLIVLCAALVVTGRLSGLAVILASGFVFWRYARVARTQFGGISGDLAGWFLQKCELWQLAAIVVCRLLGVGI